jgi:hypothetical protein
MNAIRETGLVENVFRTDVAASFDGCPLMYPLVTFHFFFALI